MDKDKLTVLETERLILRHFESSDALGLFELDNDPDVMRYINGGAVTPMQVIQQAILPTFLTYDEHLPLFGFWAVLTKNQQDFIGWISFRLIADKARVASLGYRFHKHVWGQGFATEGANALIQKGFTDLELERIVATTYEKNLASQRVLEKLGFKLVRRFRMTQEDLEHSDTSHTASLELWEGDDLEFALDKVDYLI